jgi:hypothetical protein
MTRTQDVTDDEIQQAAKILRKLEPGYLPFPIFIEAARLVTFSIVELLPYRRNANGTVEVLLLRREEDDTLWPNMWHNPGAVIRPTDVSVEEVIDRIFVEELGTQRVGHTIEYLGSLHHRTRRGAEHASVYAVEIKSQPPCGTFFPLNQLPPDTIESHIQVAQMAERIA